MDIYLNMSGSDDECKTTTKVSNIINSWSSIIRFKKVHEKFLFMISPQPVTREPFSDDIINTKYFNQFPI